MRSVFNEKVDEKWNLWVQKQCIGPTCGWELVEKSNFLAKKKKKSKNANVHLESKFCASQTHPTSTTPIGGGVAIMPLP